MTYEMLTSKLPYPELTSQKYESNKKAYSSWQYQSALDYREDIPFWLDLALRRAVEADPKLRYQLYSEFITDISKPNTSAENEFKNRPFMERDPILFWKLISGGLAIAVISLLIELFG